LITQILAHLVYFKNDLYQIFHMTQIVYFSTIMRTCFFLFLFFVFILGDKAVSKVVKTSTMFC